MDEKPVMKKVEIEVEASIMSVLKYLEKCFDFDVAAYLSKVLNENVKLDLDPEEGGSWILEKIGEVLWSLYTGEGWK